MGFARVFAATALATCVMVVAHSSAVHAASVVIVNSTSDPVPVLGACQAGTGSCSLREAIIFANGHPGSTISLPAGNFVLNQMGAGEPDAKTGDLDIHADVTINGVGEATVIDGHGTVLHDRVFDIYPNPGTPTLTVAFNGVRIINGYANDSFGGGGMWIGASTHVSLTNSSLEQNLTYAGRGGGIDLYGSGSSLDVVNSRIDSNFTFAGTVGQPSGGGAIYVGDGVVNITRSWLNNNQIIGGQAGASGSNKLGGDAAGGAIEAEGTSVVTITDSTLSHSIAVGGGATAGAGFENMAGWAFGGAVASRGSAARFTIVNSTLVDNSARGGAAAGPVTGRPGDAYGGAISVGGAPVLINVTIARNTAISGTPVSGGNSANGFGGGMYTGSAAGGRMANTLIALNSISTANLFYGADLFSPLSMNGANLIGDREGNPNVGTPLLSGTRTIPLDPLLGSGLADNGGPQPTLALRPGSPAINAGDSAACAEVHNLDQRGVSRPDPVGGQCDIGAFEYQFTPTSMVLSSSANAAAIGQAVTLTATISAPSGTPTGVITIRDGATSLGGGTIAGGVVSVTTAGLSPGSHAITASYSGDTLFAPSTVALTQIVGVGSTVGLQFFPLAKPVRLLDTRPGHSALVAPSAPLVASQPLVLPGRFTIDGVTVPSEALALVGNATVDNTAGVPAGFATLWPNGSPLPLASNLNFVPGTVRPNSFTVGFGADGKFDLLSNTGGDFILDITGYYAPPNTGGLYFHPLAKPVRLLDTRADATAVVHPNVSLTPGQTLNLAGGTGGAVPASAKALAGNATVDNGVNAAPGFATLFPGGTNLPPTSNLNFTHGTVAPNAFTVALGSDGSFNLYSNTGGDFVIDVTGYYDDVAAGGLLFHALSQPVRELDTRPGSTAVVHPNAPIAAGTSINLPGEFSVAGIDVPPSAALVGNATVDNSSNAPAGFATLYPGGTDLPLASNLNYTPGLTAPNAFIVGTGGDGTYRLYSQSATHFIIDISGYFSAT